MIRQHSYDRIEVTALSDATDNNGLQNHITTVADTKEIYDRSQGQRDTE